LKRYSLIKYGREDDLGELKRDACGGEDSDEDDEDDREGGVSALVSFLLHGVLALLQGSTGTTPSVLLMGVLAAPGGAVLLTADAEDMFPFTLLLLLLRWKLLLL